jgi:ArsR family transcriptional regulator
LNTSPSAGSKGRPSRPPRKAAAALKISDETLAGLTEVFKMLADKSRLRILLALAQDGELHVSALCALLGESQPAVSHHLALLRMQGLVAFRRAGKHNFYRVASGLVRELLEQFFADAANGQTQLHFEDFSLVYKRK